MSTGPDQNPVIGEQLSAWLDDELPQEEVELLVTRLERSPEQRARIARYGLIGATLRDGQHGMRSASLEALQVSGRVSAVLDAPAAQPIPQPVVRTARLLPYAVAAGVALAAVALVPLIRPGLAPAGGPGLEMAGPVTAPVPAVLSARPYSPAAERVGAGPQASLSPRRLTNYLVYHGEYSGMLSAKLTDTHIVSNRSYAAVAQVADQPPQ